MTLERMQAVIITDHWEPYKLAVQFKLECMSMAFATISQRQPDIGWPYAVQHCIQL